MSARFDAVTLEVLWTRLISVVDEAAKAIVRTSFSTLSNEANDFACMLTDERGGALAQNSGSIPSFIGTLPATVRHFLRAMGAAAMRPGDVLITNDAWMGTGHMSDVCVLKPIFRAGRLVAFSATTSHMPDIGGRLRAIEAREVFEEGIHIPLMKLRREGRTDETLIEMIRANVRTPDQTAGDIWAQVGANELMEKRLLALMDAAGLETLDELGDELFTRAERAMRAAIRAVPDGTYRYAMRTDGVDEPLDYRVALTIAGDEITADYTGTSPQQPRAINCVMAYTYAMTAYAIKCALLPGLANNEGMYRPMRVTAPEGSLLNPRFPVAVVSRAVTGHYVPVLLFGALHQVIPDRVMAGAGSPLWAVQQTGLRADGRPYTNIFFFNGGMGATPSKDGEHVLSWPSNISSTPIEVAERNSPLFFREKRLTSGSGGAGGFAAGSARTSCACASRTCRSSPRSWRSARNSRHPASRAATPAGSGTCRSTASRSTTAASTCSSAATSSWCARRAAAATARSFSAIRRRPSAIARSATESRSFRLGSGLPEPVDAVAVEDADRAPFVLEKSQVGERLADREAQLVAVELAPEEHRHQLRRGPRLDQRVERLVEPRGVMVAQEGEPRVQAAERETVRRQHQGVRRHRLEAAERVEIEAQRIEPGLLGPDTDVGRDLRQDLIAGDQHAARFVPEARVLGRVAEDRQNAKRPAADRDCIALTDAPELARHLRHEARIVIAAASELHERLGPAAVPTEVGQARLEVGRATAAPGVLRVEPLRLRAPELGLPTRREPARVAHVIGMEVRHEHALHRPAAEMR